MDSKIYDNIMNNPPRIDRKYLAGALGLRVTQLISDVQISKVIESNTALVIKIKIFIKENGELESTRQLFIKTIKYNHETNTYHNTSLKETKFYKLIQSGINANLPVAKCFDAYISEDKSKFLLLLEDLSNEFNTSNKVDLTAEKVWLSAASSLAKFHAAFWNSDKIGSKELPIDNIEKINFYIKNIHESYEKFIRYVGNQFDTETQAIYQNAIKISTKLETERYERLIGNNNVTLTHGDSHIHNFMFPHNEKKLPIIIDFQFCGIGIGVKDIAHLTRESFPKIYGEKLHISIMKKYYETLLANGVGDYSWDACWNDYRKQVASMLLIPMWQYTCFNLPFDNWSKDISNLVLNYKLLSCDQLVK